MSRKRFTSEQWGVWFSEFAAGRMSVGGRFANQTFGEKRFALKPVSELGQQGRGVLATYCLARHSIAIECGTLHLLETTNVSQRMMGPLRIPLTGLEPLT